MREVRDEVVFLLQVELVVNADIVVKVFFL